MSTELKHIETALNEPFPCTLIRFKPKQPRQNTQTKRWECLALPYADKRVYEDRLNELAFGDWSTPYTPPIVAGNKLVVPVTVIIYGVSHTDFGEAFLSSTTRKGDIREEENSATEAYSQAFRRACSQFGLGRYLYQLPKLWLPYDQASRSIALTEEARASWVEKLYHDAGLLSPSARQTQQVHPTPPTPQGHRQRNQNDTPQTNLVSTTAPTSPTAPTAPSPTTPVPQQRKKTVTKPEQPVQPIERVDEQLLKYLQSTLNAEQTKKACQYYHVNDLTHLTPQQAIHLSEYIEQQQKTGSRA